MYNLDKIIIMGNYDLEDQIGIETVVMKTKGLKIESILYLNSSGSIGENKKDLKNEIIGELYADQYDEDDLKIKIKECINGEDCMCKIRNFIIKKWNPDTLIYYYEPDEDCYEYLKNELLKENKDIFIQEFHDIFIDGKNTDNDIYEIMKINNLKVENLIKENKISMIYFLSALVEKLLSK